MKAKELTFEEVVERFTKPYKLTKQLAVCKVVHTPSFISEVHLLHYLVSTIASMHRCSKTGEQQHNRSRFTMKHTSLSTGSQLDKNSVHLSNLSCLLLV